MTISFVKKTMMSYDKGMKKLGKALLFFLCIALTCFASFAEESADEGNADNVRVLSISNCLNIGLSNNIDIKIAQIESEIAGQDVLLSEAIFDTFLSASATYSDDQRVPENVLFGTKNLVTDYKMGATKKLPTGTELGVSYVDERRWTNSTFTTENPIHDAELSFSLRQPVLKNFFGFVDRQSVKLAKIEAKIKDIQAFDRIENAVADIQKAYWELAYYYQTVAFRTELFKQAEELYNTYSEHLKTGLVETTNVYETEANMRIRKAELLISENNLITASNKLKLLLYDDGDYVISPEEKLEVPGGKVDLVESLNTAFIANREYLIKKKSLESKKVNLKMKKNSLWPQVDLVGTFSLNGVDRKFEKANRNLTAENNPLYYGGVEFSVPLENTAARGEFQTAILEKEEAILEILNTEKALATEIDDKVRAVNLLSDNSKRWTKIREIQYNKFIDEKKKLSYGRSTSKTVIDYQNDLMLASLREYLNLYDYYASRIDLENAMDTLLKKVGVLG